MSLSKSRTIASLTKKNEILLLPGFEELDHCTAKELKEYVKKRAAIYANQYKKKIRGFTVGDFIEIYNKDPKPYKPYQRKAIDNLKEDIDKISSSAKKAKEDLKEFEADKTIESREISKAKAKEEPPKKSKEEPPKKSKEERERENEEYKRRHQQEVAELKAKRAAAAEAEFQAELRRNIEEREREQAERDRQWEADVKAAQERRKREQQEEEFWREMEQDDIMEEREYLRNIIKEKGKNSIEYNEALDEIRSTRGEGFLEKVLK